MLKGMKIAELVNSDGMLCIICLFRTEFTLGYCKVVKIF